MDHNPCLRRCWDSVSVSAVAALPLGLEVSGSEVSGSMLAQAQAVEAGSDLSEARGGDHLCQSGRDWHRSGWHRSGWRRLVDCFPRLGPVFALEHESPRGARRDCR